MNEVLWTMPVPVTGIIQGVFFKVLPKRQCELSFSIESEAGSGKWLALLFSNVEVFKCTYLASLGSVDRELRTQAYGKVISVVGSKLLNDVDAKFQEYQKAIKGDSKPLKHLMICFDDGPCYEFVCGDFKASEKRSDNVG